MILVCGLLGVCGPQSVRAEDQKPKDFYKHNYASAPGYEGDARALERPSAPNRSVGAASPIAETKEVGTSRVSPPRHDAKKATISVFVNSLDREHFGRVVQEVVRLHDAHRAVFAGIFHIGDYEAVTPEVEKELSKRKISIYQLTSVLPELFAEVSPTWVVSTREGRHVAEGFLEIERFFDEWGEYNPKRGEESVEHSKMEDF